MLCNDMNERLPNNQPTTKTKTTTTTTTLVATTIIPFLLFNISSPYINCLLKTKAELSDEDEQTNRIKQQKKIKANELG